MFDAAVADELAGLVDRLGGLPAAVSEDAARIDVIAGLETLKAAAAAAQLAVVAEFAASQEAANKAMGIQARQASRGVPEQVGLARKVSPVSAARQVSRARALIEQLPATYALLRRGEISEHVATIVTTETSHLAAEDRRRVDEQLAGQLPELSPRRAEAAARRLAIEADPAAAVARAGKARKDRRVSIRPAPDTMAILSGVLPCEQGVAAYAALRRHADMRKAAGDQRSRAQIMADTLVERLTGQASADAVSAEIGLVMTDAALFFGEDTAAELRDYGPFPAELARAIARRAATTSSGSKNADNGANNPATGETTPTTGQNNGSAGQDGASVAGESTSPASGEPTRPTVGQNSGSAGLASGAATSQAPGPAAGEPDAPTAGESADGTKPGAATPASGTRGSESTTGPNAAEPAKEPSTHSQEPPADDREPSADSREVLQARVYLRRLFTDPVTGIITACDPRRRRFDGALAELLVYRDGGICRDPFCDAPIRHLDHIQTHATGGSTTRTNGRGVCERGNYVRHMPGFKIRLLDRIGHIVETTTPTGHRYRSHPPPAPGARKRRHQLRM
jgi:hypothetical protein